MKPLFLAFLLAGSFAVAYGQDARVAAWSADIDFLARELPRRHPNPYSVTSRAAFEDMLAALKTDLAMLSDFEIAVRLQQAVASLGDGHTEVDTRLAPITIYPIRLYRFADGIFVTKTTSESQGACGAELIAIDGISTAEVYDRVTTTISRENEHWAAYRAMTSMTRAELLHALGVTRSPTEATFTFALNGRTFDVTLRPVPAADANATVNAPDATTSALPLYRRDSTKRYWFEWSPESGLLYIKYNSCSEDPALRFVTFTAQIRRILDENTVNTVVVDLRDNTGGDSSIAQPLITTLKERSQLRGRIFTIIGRGTFSSALINAIQLRDEAGAILAGEPTGGKPWSYGEQRSFQLPNSRITVFHSTRFFRLEPVETPTLAPRIESSITSHDFFHGHDPFLYAVTGPGRMLEPMPRSGRRRAAPAGDIRVCP